MKLSLLLICLSTILLFTCAKGEDVCSRSTAENPIQYFFVLMQENRSFDHFLGWLKSDNPNILGLTGQEFNYVNPDDTSSQKIFVDALADLVDPDFDHGLPGTSQEIQWGSQNDDIKDVLLNGFVAQNNLHVGPTNGPLSLSMFNKTSLPILSTLAVNFANFDQYFADLPGPTMPNNGEKIPLFPHCTPQNTLTFTYIHLRSPTITSTHLHSLTLTHTHTHSHSLSSTHLYSLTLTHTHTHTHSYSHHTHLHSLILTPHSLPLAYIHSHSLILTLTHTHSLPLTYIHSHSHSLTHFHSLTFTHSHSQSLILTLTHTHTTLTYTHLHNLYLSLSLSLCLIL